MNRIIITTCENRKYIIFLKNDKPVKIRVLSPNNFYPDAVYVGCVRKIKDNISSSFVSYGNKQFGFLGKNSYKPGTLLPVIVKKQTDAHKEDVLTDKISLTGVYIILLNEKPENEGIKFSSKLSDEFKTNFPDFPELKYRVVIRSNAVNTDFDSIINEYKYLEQKLDRILEYANTRTEGTLLFHGMSECMSYAVSENLNEFSEIQTDDKLCFDEISMFISEYKKAGIKIPLTLSTYEDKEYPLYKLISIKKLLSYALEKKVYLKSGAYITIEHTEAMTVIDVNTSTTSIKGNKADVIHAVNMEAAEEIATQLKLRNISGIIVIDFINESNDSYKADLIKCVKELLKHDDSNARYVSLTKLGLMELTREKRTKPLNDCF